MFNLMTRYWWTVALRGLVAVLFGLSAFLWSDITLQVLIALFGAFVFLDGVFTLIVAISSRNIHSRWWAILLQGGISVLVGIIAIAWPEVTAVAMLYVVAFWAIAIGVLELLAGISLHKQIDGGWLLASCGALSLLFGLTLLVWPNAVLTSLIWLIGAYAIFFGALLIVFGFKLRKLDGTIASTEYAMRQPSES